MIMAYTAFRSDTPEDRRKAEEMIHDFFRDLPVAAVFGRENSFPQPRIYNIAPEDFIVKAIDSAGTIIGFAINKTNLKIYPQVSPDGLEIQEFFQFVKKNSKLDQLPKRTLELRVLWVSKEWRRRGVAKTLVEESMKEAKAAGFEAIRMCCGNEYTARLARRMGWQEQYRLAFQDYPKLSGKNLQLSNAPGHDYIYYYVIDLLTQDI
ncbi:uncharacterized protein LOC124357399 isoform X1 [Homalodisca vitripennis]|uniref:uncharacterized protein LOC124357399 isoform X1 n=2 Tax=Homalodisca vitripennis TaxID=197043 RepID=UPI001EEA3054|nr:uncharacterized protein LOC124357399 isoform X1 [Homalodisca vitripennis]